MGYQFAASQSSLHKLKVCISFLGESEERTSQPSKITYTQAKIDQLIFTRATMNNLDFFQIIMAKARLYNILMANKVNKTQQADEEFNKKLKYWAFTG